MQKKETTVQTKRWGETEVEEGSDKEDEQWDFTTLTFP